MLHAKEIAFARDSAPLFSDFSLQAAPTQLVKITGGNGAGKTTLLKILSHVLPPDGGGVYWHGKPVADDADGYREQLLYVGHASALAGDLTPLENLRAAAGLRLRPPRQPLPQALGAAGLPAAALQKPCRQLSAGQRRRAALARLQAFDAALWLLDEPLAALDESGRAMLTDWTQAHLAGGGMAVCTLHHVDDWQLPAAQVVACRRP